MQVDLVGFDAPKDDQDMFEEHMTLHKGVWSHQVRPALSLFPDLAPPCNNPSAAVGQISCTSTE